MVRILRRNDKIMMSSKDKGRQIMETLISIWEGALDVVAVIFTQPLDSELNPCSRHFCKPHKRGKSICIITVDEWMKV